FIIKLLSLALRALPFFVFSTGLSPALGGLPDLPNGNCAAAVSRKQTEATAIAAIPNREIIVSLFFINIPWLKTGHPAFHIRILTTRWTSIRPGDSIKVKKFPSQ